MKKILCILLSLNISIAFAQDEIAVKSKITRATFFLEGAQVFRSATVDLKKGNNKFIFRNLSDEIIAKSIQATGTNSYIILDVAHWISYPLPELSSAHALSPQVIKEMKTMKDSLVIMNLITEQNNNKITHLQSEKNIVINNNLMVQSDINDTLPILKEALLFYRAKLDEIDGEIYKHKIRQNTIAQTTTRLNTRLNELKTYESQTTTTKSSKFEKQHEVLVTIFSERDINDTKLEINYVIPNAGWSPAYDIRANGTDEAITLTYKANIYQASGTDWENIPIKLSTFNPTNCNLKPELPVWDVSKVSYRQKFPSSIKMKENKSAEYEYDDKKSMKTMGNVTMNTQLELTEASSIIQSEKVVKVEVDKHPSFTNIEFDIELPCNLKSSNKSILIFVSTTTINAAYQRYLVPKLDKQSYIVAKIGGWEKLNLLNGPVNIYFKNTYMGETLLDVWSPSDSLQVSLGRNQSVIALRNKIKDETKNIPLSNLKSREMTIELTVKNTNDNEEEIILQDQQPISTNEKFKIKLNDAAGAKINAITGLLEWELKLAPKETRVIKFTYIIECDRDAIIE
ncbi:MAG: DUF4139 domain-containing protein [Bacteroidetes bacterium]|nr:DUF4139 domain-containing protein [Bacteroidota bacterium]